MAIWDGLLNSVLDTLKEQVKDLWEDGKENIPFLKDIAEQIAENTWKAAFGPPENRQQHLDAIKDLEAAVRIRISSESIRIKVKKREIFMTVLVAVAKTVLNLALKVVFPVLPSV